MDHTSFLTLFLSAKSFPSANKHTQVSSIPKKHTFPWLPLHFYLLLLYFPSLPLQTSEMSYLYMLFPSSQLPPPPHSTAVRFSPPLEEPSSRSPVTSDHTESNEAFQFLTYYYQPLSPYSRNTPPSRFSSCLWLFLLSLHCRLFVNSSTFKYWYSSVSLLLPLWVPLLVPLWVPLLVNSCSLMVPLSYDDSPRLDSSPEDQT